MCTKPTVVFKPTLKKERNNQKEKKGRKEQKKKKKSISLRVSNHAKLLQPYLRPRQLGVTKIKGL